MPVLSLGLFRSQYTLWPLLVGSPQPPWGQCLASLLANECSCEGEAHCPKLEPTTLPTCEKAQPDRQSHRPDLRLTTDSWANPANTRRATQVLMNL